MNDSSDLGHDYLLNAANHLSKLNHFNMLYVLRKHLSIKNKTQLKADTSDVQKDGNVACLVDFNFVNKFYSVDSSLSLTSRGFNLAQFVKI